MAARARRLQTSRGTRGLRNSSVNMALAGRGSFLGVDPDYCRLPAPQTARHAACMKPPAVSRFTKRGRGRIPLVKFRGGIPLRYNCPKMYSPQLLDHFQNPRNPGVVAAPDAFARVENPACGDILELSMKISDGRIREIRFRAKGCVPAMACG